MMKFNKKIGNIKVYTRENAERDYTVLLYNDSDCIGQEVYLNVNNIDTAINDLVQKVLDTYTEEYLWLYYLTEGLEKLSDRTYKLGDNYFCRIDDTEYFKQLTEGNGWVIDKNGKRIIDR